MIWKDIEDYEGIYRINSTGVVESVNRITPHGHHRIGKPMEIENCRGYLRVNLTKNGKQNHLTIHRLVAKAFIPNPYNKPTVNHIDGNPLNNNVTNLEWATIKEQNLHAEMLGLKGYKGSKNPNSKLTDEDVKQIRILLSEKKTLKYIAKQFRVSLGLIGLIKQNRIWKHI